MSAFISTDFVTLVVNPKKKTSLHSDLITLANRHLENVRLTSLLSFLNNYHPSSSEETNASI